MKDDMEGRIISRGKYGDGMLYCRENGYRSHLGDKEGLLEVCLS